MSQRARSALAWGLGLLLVGAALAWVASAFVSKEAGPQRLRIATGAEGGSYLPIGRSIAASLDDLFDDVTPQALVTAGSVGNAARLKDGAAELAILQDDTPPDPVLRSVVPLYDEVLQVVVRTRGGDAPADLASLAGSRIAVGVPGSGTARVARRVLAHLGVDDSQATVRDIGGKEALEALRAGDVDAVFAMGGLPSPFVRDLLDVPGARLVGLGSEDGEGSAVDGVTRALTPLHGALIPVGTYGRVPAEPVGTVAVSAVLVAHRDLPDAAVQAITRAVLAHGAALRAEHPFLSRLHEIDPEERLAYPLHPGALDYYTRYAPSFFVTYAEPISLAFTLIVALCSAFLGLRQWLRRRRKNRIDTYYEEIAVISEDVAGADATALRALKVRLLDLHRKAFRELIDERLAADESFRIFQSYLSSELAAVDAHLEGRSI